MRVEQDETKPIKSVPVPHTTIEETLTLESKTHKSMEIFNNDELLKLFTQYALKEGSSNLLSTEGLKSMLQSHFSNLLGSMTLNDVVKYADLDKDGKVTFNDFKSMLTKLSGLVGLSNLTGLIS